jgi:hypothetical protein
MFIEKESLLPILKEDSRFVLLLAFIKEYRELYEIRWHELNDRSISEGSCIAQDERQARQVLELVFNAVVWLLACHPDRFPQTQQKFELELTNE